MRGGGSIWRKNFKKHRLLLKDHWTFTNDVPGLDYTMIHLERVYGNVQN